MNQREIIYAFIDSQNLNLGVLSLGWKLDFLKFRKYLNDKYKVDKVLLFLGYIKSNTKLYDYLTNAGYKLVFKQVVKTNKKIKGNVDAELIVWTMKSVYEKICDRAIIISGDGDFAILADFLLDKNKLLRFIVPNYQSMSILIKKVFIKKNRLDLLDSLNGKEEKLSKKQPLYRSGNR